MNRFDDQRAWFCERVNENSGGLYWLAKSILHNNEDVKDAVQEAVLTAYEKLDTLRDEHSFKPWIMRILANTAYSMIRRSKPNTDIDSLAEELPAPQDEDREESMALPLRYNKDKRKNPVFSRVSAFVVAYSIPFPTLIASEKSVE